ncbi:MAG: ABC transporter substrate-binding protein [Proteobacteria bacterium]|nr:ABC transporter substrate-binding protein [Pseudomonadota bacterium]
MKRRTLATLLAGTALSPLGARAQQPTAPVVGLLSSRAPAESAAHVAGLRQGLAESGYIEGQNLTIESRWAEGAYDRLPVLARELVERRVAIIVAVGSTPSALAAKAATSTIPIVFVGSDPVRAGLVTSINRPGGNITGVSLISADLGGKRLELICEMAPKADVVAVLLNPNELQAEAQKQSVQAAARSLGKHLLFLAASREAEFEPAFATAASARAGALVVGNDPFFDSQRGRLIALASRFGIPAIYHIREFPAAGGLMSYGASLADGYRQAGVYAGRILKGARPGDLPIVQPTHFELVVNLGTARALGLTAPASLLALASEVIE